MSEENRCPACGAPLPAHAPQGICPGCLLKRGIETAPPASEAGQPNGDFTPPTPQQLAAQFPDLEILEFIGRGGMGMVYKARQRHLDRLVALKILLPDIARDPAFAERFAREARAMAMLSHPHVVTVYDFGQTTSPRPLGEGKGEGGLYYFLMEFIDGLTLRQLLDARKLAPQEALAIVPQICEALQYAHDKGLVHRDIKPENILIDRAGQVKIADFGLAKLVGREVKDFSLTGSGQVMGTPHYMAPEQLEHPQEVDHRADIYSLGVVFYQMLTGELPIGRFAPPSKKVQVDVRLDEVVLRALEKEPELRYQQANEVKSRVETIVTTPTSSGFGATQDGARGDEGAIDEARHKRQGSHDRLLTVLRWSARLLGTLMLLMIGLFAVGEGIPAIWTQPADVRIEFVGFFLVAAGILIGWKWEGWAALLILAGLLEFHVVEWRLVLQGALELPLIVAVLYGLCWWIQWHRAGGGSAHRRWFAKPWVHKTLASLAVALLIALIFFAHGRAPANKSRSQQAAGRIEDAKPGAASPAAPMERRTIDKLVSKFPAALDLSTPEAACAAFLRASAQKDARAVVNLSWIPLDVKDGEQWIRDAERQDPEAAKIFFQALAESKVVEVTTDGSELASVVTFLPLPEGEAAPYSIRAFGRIDGQWKNMGEVRVPDLAAARAEIDKKREALRQQFEGLKKDRGAHRDSDSQSKSKPAPPAPADPMQSPRAAEMRTIVLAALEYATEHPQWPKTLDELKPKYLDGNKIDLSRFVYHPLSRELLEKNPQEVPVLSEKEPAFAGAQLVGFADGYIEFIPATTSAPGSAATATPSPRKAEE